MTQGLGSQTRATLVGGECSHHYAIPAPHGHNIQLLRAKS